MEAAVLHSPKSQWTETEKERRKLRIENYCFSFIFNNVESTNRYVRSFYGKASIFDYFECNYFFILLTLRSSAQSVAQKAHRFDLIQSMETPKAKNKKSNGENKRFPFGFPLSWRISRWKCGKKIARTNRIINSHRVIHALDNWN